MHTCLKYFSLGLCNECLSMIMLICVNSFASKWQESGENMIHRYLSSKSDIYAKMVGTQGLFLTTKHGRGCVNTTFTFWAVSLVSLKAVYYENYIVSKHACWCT